MYCPGVSPPSPPSLDTGGKERGEEGSPRSCPWYPLLFSPSLPLPSHSLHSLQYTSCGQAGLSWLVNEKTFFRFTTRPGNLLEQPSVETTEAVPTSVFPPARAASRAHVRVEWWWRQMAGRVLINRQQKLRLKVPNWLFYLRNKFCKDFSKSLVQSFLSPNKRCTWYTF